MKRLVQFLSLVLIAGFLSTGCEGIFGSKSDSITDDIFRSGRQDPNIIIEDVGYAALLPFWEGFNRPTDVFVGFDEMVYVTDADGVHVLDRAGRRAASYPLRGAISVTQDRLLNVYVAARYDTVVASLPPPRNTFTWDLAAVYKFRNLNGAGPVQLVQVLKHPFMDASRSTTTTQTIRLNRDLADNDELVQLTGIAVLANNDIYISRKGPRNQTGQAVAQDNTVLLFTENRDANNNRLGTMRNVAQVRTLNPNTPSLLSAISVNDIVSFIGPPQRENIPNNVSFLLAQGAPERDIPFRVLWVDAVDTPDGIEYRSNGALLNRDTTRADGFLYQEGKFRNPTGLAFSADARNHIFVVDSHTHRLHMFQSNGFEGVNPPPGSNRTKTINVSFGADSTDVAGNRVIDVNTGQPYPVAGSGPREFRSPSGVAYFRQVVYVADTGNNRIARYKLNTDFE